jgi:anaerobic selenocysteine-containing dehydrogenase
VLVNDADADRLGLHTGQTIAVIAHSGRLDLPVRVTSGVVSGCVVVPGPSSDLGSLGASGTGPLRVRLETSKPGETP